MHGVRYYLGSSSHLSSEAYATLDEAADAVRRANGWMEIHLFDLGPSTEAALPTWIAYPTPEERDSDDTDTMWKAPWIYEMWDGGREKR